MSTHEKICRALRDLRLINEHTTDDEIVAICCDAAPGATLEQITAAALEVADEHEAGLSVGRVRSRDDDVSERDDSSAKRKKMAAALQSLGFELAGTEPRTIAAICLRAAPDGTEADIAAAMRIACDELKARVGPPVGDGGSGSPTVH